MISASRTASASVAHLGRVVPEPVVGLPEVVEDDPGSVVSPGGQHDGGAGVRLGGDPRAVQRVQHQEHAHQAHERSRQLHQRPPSELLNFSCTLYFHSIYFFATIHHFAKL